jgi:hypothetical protein
MHLKNGYMRKLLTVILLLTSLKSFSQDEPIYIINGFPTPIPTPPEDALYNATGFLPEHFIQDPLFNTNYSSSSTVMVYGNAYLTSNALNQSFYQDVLNYGYIDNTTKNNISNSLGPLNTVDFNYNLSVAYRHRLDSILGCPTGNLIISLSTRSLSSVRFSNDDFNLIFFGNAQYAGQTAYLSGSNASLNYYNQLRIGWNGTTPNHNGSSVSFGFGVSFLQGRKDFDLNVPAGTLYTQQDGEYINANYNLTYKTNDSTASNLLTFNGAGASLDAFVEKKFSSTFSVSFSASDVGFIDWGKRSLQATADSSIHFTGYNAGDIFQLTDTAFNKINKDSILKLLGVKEHQQSYVTTLPFHLELSCAKYIPAWHSVISGGIVYWYYDPSQFILYAKFNHTFGRHFFAGVSADVNSMGSFEAGLDAGLQLNHLSLFASAGNLFENFIPETSTSATAGVSIAYSF